MFQIRRDSLYSLKFINLTTFYCSRSSGWEATCVAASPLTFPSRDFRLDSGRRDALDDPSARQNYKGIVSKTSDKSVDNYTLDSYFPYPGFGGLKGGEQHLMP